MDDIHVDELTEIVRLDMSRLLAAERALPDHEVRRYSTSFWE